VNTNKTNERNSPLKGQVSGNGATPILIIAAIMFTSALLIANVMANYMFRIGPFPVDGGFFMFPLTYILSDLISEVYGYRWSRRIAWTSLAINAMFALLIIMLVRLPSAGFAVESNEFFSAALGNTWRIVVASLIAYCVGDLVDDRIFRYLRAKTENMKGFAFRALASSLAGHILDTTLFCIIAFAYIPFIGLGEVVPWVAPEGMEWYSGIFGMILLGIIMKWGYEWAVIPITYRVTKWARKKEGLE
jgi:hypothetical protein